MKVLLLVAENWDVVVTVLLAIVSIVKATTWGRANARALEAVTGVIERTKAKDVKAEVASTERRLPAAVRDALADAVATVDPGKKTPTVAQRVLREILRKPGQ